jgi:hypothetical protein
MQFQFSFRFDFVPVSCKRGLTVDVINSLCLTNNKASSYWYVQGDAGYDKYTYVKPETGFFPDLYPVDYYLVPSGIWARSDIRLPSGIRQTTILATPSGKDRCYFKK